MAEDGTIAVLVNDPLARLQPKTNGFTDPARSNVMIKPGEFHVISSSAEPAIGARSARSVCPTSVKPGDAVRWIRTLSPNCPIRQCAAP